MPTTDEEEVTGDDQHATSFIAEGMRVVVDPYRDDKFKMALDFVVEALQNKIKNLPDEDFKGFSTCGTFWGIWHRTSWNKLLERLTLSDKKSGTSLRKKSGLLQTYSPLTMCVLVISAWEFIVTLLRAISLIKSSRVMIILGVANRLANDATFSTSSASAVGLARETCTIDGQAQ